MSRLSVDQKTIFALLSDKNANFLIPDYQRPYAWGEIECQTLWDDLFNFAFPNNDCDMFDAKRDEYYLGSIVTFVNQDKRKEVIDGQQRLTTLLLLLRAFYVYLGKMNDMKSTKTRMYIEQCLWQTDTFGTPNKEELKIDSEVASDNDKGEFLDILKKGEAPIPQKCNATNTAKGMDSQYADNYRFFLKAIETFNHDYPGYFAYFPMRILNNCIVLPIEADAQDTALRIFSTLNDRGKPLSDADIFKAQFYKYYTQLGKTQEFIGKWKKLEELCGDLFSSSNGSPMDEIFTRYMYYLRAKQGNKKTTTEALRKFYEKDGYKVLHSEQTFEDLIALTNFWEDATKADSKRFSKEVLRQLYILKFAPNRMWTYIISVYFMQYKDKAGQLENKNFLDLLKRVSAFTLAYAVVNPGVNQLRGPMYSEMINIVNGQKVLFADFRFAEDEVRAQFTNYSFRNGRPITKSMLAWWMFHKQEQRLPDDEGAFDVEHIYARNRYEKEKSLADERNLIVLGNKAFLEKDINIAASDYKFADKKPYYLGKRGKRKMPTINVELLRLTKEYEDFTEKDIIARNEQILQGFYDYLREMGLFKES